MYYKTCEYCGAHLDPGERCDCNKITLSMKEAKSNGITGCRRRIGYAAIVAGLVLCIAAAGGSDLETMSESEIVITALIGIALMIAGDILKDKKRTIRRTIASKANCSK